VAAAVSAQLPYLPGGVKRRRGKEEKVKKVVEVEEEDEEEGDELEEEVEEVEELEEGDEGVEIEEEVEEVKVVRVLKGKGPIQPQVPRPIQPQVPRSVQPLVPRVRKVTRKGEPGNSYYVQPYQPLPQRSWQVKKKRGKEKAGTFTFPSSSSVEVAGIDSSSLPSAAPFAAASPPPPVVDRKSVDPIAPQDRGGSPAEFREGGVV